MRRRKTIKMHSRKIIIAFIVATFGMLLTLQGFSWATLRYTVQPGDSLWFIAQTYNTTVADIMAYNGLSNADIIYPGDVLWVPGLADSDFNLLSQLVQAESEGEPYAGQVAVAAVVLNRVNDPNFPKTVPEVVYEPYQFQPVTNGYLYSVPYGGNQVARQATEDAAKGWDPSYGALFFYNPRTAGSWWIRTRPVTTAIGNHVFAR